jgi:hypothetical protein
MFTVTAEGMKWRNERRMENEWRFNGVKQEKNLAHVSVPRHKTTGPGIMEAVKEGRIQTKSARDQIAEENIWT